MRNDLIDLANELRLVTDIEVFWERIGAELKKFSISNFLYCVAASRKEVIEKGFMQSLIIKNNYPNVYFDAFGASTFLENDLTAVLGFQSACPILWHDETVWENATPEEALQSRVETEIGFGVGISVPTGALSPNHIGGIGLCAAGITGLEFNVLWQAKSVEIMQILNFLDFGMRRKHLPKMLGLSQREKEVLSWLASGFRPDQIADRLSIGYRTVDKYINSSKQKLNASTRDQAVAKALIFNVIQP